MDYSSGYEASFFATFVDPVTWADLSRIEIVSGSISRSDDALKQSANLVLREQYEEANDRYIRIYMDAHQGNDSERVPLFTGLASAPKEGYNNGVVDGTLECYSVLKVAEDIFLDKGWYASAGQNGGTLVENLLSVIPANVEIADNPPPITASVVAEDNESRLSMAEYIVDSIGWRLQISGDGSVLVSPDPDEPSAIFSPYDYDVIETSFNKSRDWFSCPNVLRVTTGDFSAIVRDDSEDSDLSTVNRGREIWAAEDNVTLSNNESLGKFGLRRLQELQAKTEKVDYKRRFVPEVNQDDMIRINYPDLQGDFYVESQDITLGANANTSEKVYRIL